VNYVQDPDGAPIRVSMSNEDFSVLMREREKLAHALECAQVALTEMRHNMAERNKWAELAGEKEGELITLRERLAQAEPYYGLNAEEWAGIAVKKDERLAEAVKLLDEAYTYGDTESWAARTKEFLRCADRDATAAHCTTDSADAALNEIANRPDPCAFGHE
jgi:hypothetical protein